MIYYMLPLINFPLRLMFAAFLLGCCSGHKEHVAADCRIHISDDISEFDLNVCSLIDFHRIQWPSDPNKCFYVFKYLSGGDTCEIKIAPRVYFPKSYIEENMQQFSVKNDSMIRLLDLYWASYFDLKDLQDVQYRSFDVNDIMWCAAENQTSAVAFGKKENDVFFILFDGINDKCIINSIYSSFDLLNSHDFPIGYDPSKY